MGLLDHGCAPTGRADGERRPHGSVLGTVTDPEPLPQNHRLWSMPNCLITPHIANTPEMGLVLLEQRVAENVRRYCADEPLLGLVDVKAGY